MAEVGTVKGLFAIAPSQCWQRECRFSPPGGLSVAVPMAFVVDGHGRPGTVNSSPHLAGRVLGCANLNDARRTGVRWQIRMVAKRKDEMGLF